jgi:hypothetical protein
MANATAEPKAPKAIKYVQATKDGTYPRKGDTYPIYRKAGSVFELNRADDLSPEWMREVNPDEVPALDEQPRGVPQTAARPRGTSISPFPPMA